MRARGPRRGEGGPRLLARAPPPRCRLVRWAGRNRAAVVAAVGIGLAAVAAFIGIGYQLKQARLKEREARAAQRREAREREKVVVRERAL